MHITMPQYNEATLERCTMTEVLSTMTSKADPMDPEGHCPPKSYLNSGINELTEDQVVKSSCDITEKYKCMFCSKGFASSSNMKRHLRRHTGERPFGCPECDCKFSLKSTLLVHQRLHTGEKPFTCEICHKSFRSGPNLISHRKLHNDDRPHECEECGKKFVQRSHLAVHRTLHAEEKPFVCTHCDKRFSQASTLNRHFEIHKDREVFVCNVCGKKFVKEHSLELHQKAHSGVKDFECKDCGRTFTQKNSLNRHKRQSEFSCRGRSQNRTGSRETAYECDVCLRVFKKKSLLRTHINAHLGEKPFACEECGKKFTARRSLTHHLKLSCKGKSRLQVNYSNLCLPSYTVHDNDVAPRSVSFMEATVDRGNKTDPNNDHKQGLLLAVESPALLSRFESPLLDKVEKMTEQLSLNKNISHKTGCLFRYSMEVPNFPINGNISIKSEKIADNIGEEGRLKNSTSSQCPCQIEDSFGCEDINVKEEIEIVEEDIDERFS